MEHPPPEVWEAGDQFKKMFYWELNEMFRICIKGHVSNPNQWGLGGVKYKNSFC